MNRRTLIVSALLVMPPSLVLAAPVVAPLDPPPSGLSPAGRAWLQSYQAVDGRDFSICMDKVKLAHEPLECLHYPPAMKEEEEVGWLRGKVAPLGSLPHGDALVLARFFVRQEPKIQWYLMGWNGVRNLVQANDERAAPPQDARSLQAAREAAGLAAYQTMQTIKTLFLLALFGGGGIFGLIWLRKRNEVKRKALNGYRPPIYWDKEMRGDSKHVTPQLLETRSAMPPFILWYQEGHHNGQKWPGRSVWVSAIDGNRNLGPADASMPVYMQMQFKGERHIRLFQITPEIARDLTNGPVGDRTFSAREHPSNKLMDLHTQSRDTWRVYALTAS